MNLPQLKKLMMDYIHTLIVHQMQHIRHQEIKKTRGTTRHTYTNAEFVMNVNAKEYYVNVL